MTDQQKRQIANLVIEQAELLGSYKAVANKANTSEATVSQIVNENWELIADRMWLRIGGNLGWKNDQWQIVETVNTKMICQVLDDAKERGMWMPVSYPAGAGKTVGCQLYMGQKTKGVYYVQCWRWNNKEFLIELCRQLGINIRGGYISANSLMREVVDYFKQRINLKPLLIIDEADKLRPNALMNLIPLYNELEGLMGVVILGTENLKKEIKRGVNYALKGFDEIDSRFGRNYIQLVGVTKSEIMMICKANGIENRAASAEIFNEGAPRQKNINGQVLMVVEDLRRIKRAVEREVVKQDTKMRAAI